MRQLSHQQNIYRRTGARVLSPSSGVRPGARALNLELPTSFGAKLFVGILGLLFGSLFFGHPAYAAFSASVSRSGTVNIAEVGSSTIRPTSVGTLGTGSDVVTVTTNCTAGYNLYVSATSSGGTNLTLADGSDYIPTSSNLVGSETALARDTWGVGKTASAFSGLQDYAIDISELTPFYTGNSTSDYTFYYGVNVSTAKKPGTYSGEVLYTVLMNSACISYTLNFDDNGATTSTLVSRELNFGDTIDLAEISSAISKTGYILTGWQGQDGNTYGITGEVNVNPDDMDTVTLTAMWEEDGPVDEGDLGTMQSFNCQDLGSGHIATLTDARDGQTYGVYRIPVDQTYAGTSTIANVAGKCIMTKDLNLGAVASVSGASSSITANGTMTLSPNDSGFSSPGGSGETITVPTSSVTVSNGTGSWGSSSSSTNTYTNKKYTTGGTGNYAGRGYYTWGAAMVACPKNWRLPTADEYSNSTSWEGQTAGLAAIVKGSNASATISNITGSPYSFVLGGDYFGSFNYATSNGYYWSSTQYSSTNSYDLRMNSSYGLERYYNDKYYGFAVRCIADPVRYDGTMQDFDASTFSATVGASAYLKDTRDGKIYAVKRLPDGKVWMMQNLTIGSTVIAETGLALTKADTNTNNDDTYYLPPANKQGTGAITQLPNVSGTPTDANFAEDSAANDIHSKTRFRVKDSGLVNDSDTGYYNFYTATLGFSSYQDGKTSGSSTRDICPKGWRLPHTTDAGSAISAITTVNDFTYLARQYGGDGWTSDPTSGFYYTVNSTVTDGMHKLPASPLAIAIQNGYAGFSYSGGYIATDIVELGQGGRYWTSSISDTRHSYRLYVGATGVYPQGGSYASIGNAVRCVAK